MLRNRWFWFFFLWAGLSLALFLLTQSAITQANADRIQAGMTIAEVKAILGGPPGFHTNRLIIMKQSVTRGSPLGWVGYGGIVWVYLDEDTNRVLRVEFEPLAPPPTLLDYLICLWPRWLPR